MTPTMHPVLWEDNGGNAKMSTTQHSLGAVRAIRALVRCVLKEICIPWVLAPLRPQSQIIPIILVPMVAYGIPVPTILSPSKVVARAIHAMGTDALPRICVQPEFIR